MEFADVIGYFRQRSRAFYLFAGAAGIIGIGALDFATGPELSVSIFYLLPISLVAWYIGNWAGFLFSGIGAATWLMLDLLQHAMGVHPVVHYWNALVRLGFFCIVVLLQDSLKREQTMARLDPLTHAGNTRYFYEIAGRELERAIRYAHPFSMVYLDIDDFKAVNDSFGHSEGDRLLRLVADTIKNGTRRTDFLARMGGDEFALLLPETAAEPALALVRKINELLLKEVKERKRPVTFTIGAATFLRPPGSVDEMIKMVDGLMYEGKKSGKNTIRHEVYGGS